MRLTRVMSGIRSYIFFDVETTGLPYCDIGPTKITELSMVSVLKGHFERTPFVVPRVLNKATFCLNPMKFISDASSRITGLKNDLLDDVGSFDENFCDMLNNFIDRLPQPVCLLAHNGDRFDFPILKSHIKAKNKEFSDSVLCADTLKAFRELKVMEKNPKEWSTNIEEFDAIDSKEVVRIIEEIELEFGNKLFGEAPCTPQKKPEKPERKEGGARRALDMTSGSPGDFRSETTPTARRNGISYKLGDVHKHVTGSGIDNQHTSEADALALLNIIAALGPPFHEWVDNNCQPFKNVKRMW